MYLYCARSLRFQIYCQYISLLRKLYSDDSIHDVKLKRFAVLDDKFSCCAAVSVFFCECDWQRLFSGRPKTGRGGAIEQPVIVCLVINVIENNISLCIAVSFKEFSLQFENFKI